MPATAIPDFGNTEEAMHAANREHLAIVLEVVAFVLVTPEFIGPGRIRQISRWLFNASMRALQLRDLQALIPPRQINMTELRRRMRGLGAEIRAAWGMQWVANSSSV